MAAIDRRPFVVFDMDDVLANLRDTLMDVLAKETGINIHWERWSTFEIHNTYGVSVDRMLNMLIDNAGLERCTLESGAIETFLALRQADYRIGILTARAWHPSGKDITSTWLREHNLMPDHLALTHHGEPKSAVLPQFDEGNIALFVDDNLRNVADVSSKGVRSVTFDRPWNQGAHEHGRIYHLSEVPQLVCKVKAMQPVRRSAHL